MIKCDFKKKKKKFDLDGKIYRPTSKKLIKEEKLKIYIKP